MPKTNKGIDTQKLFDQIAKADLDDQILFYHAFKSHLSDKILKRTQELEDKANQLHTIKDEINSPNGKEKAAK